MAFKLENATVVTTVVLSGPGDGLENRAIIWYLACSTCRPKNEQSSSEPEAIPPGEELVGLSFTSVGATDPPK